MLRLRTLAQRFVKIKDGREIWKFLGGKYKANEVWDEIRKKREKVAWHRLLWSSIVVLKHAVISWMAILNRLPTKDKLKSWGMDLLGDYMLCKKDQETRDHIFF